ncbi:MAG: hypothetical protein ACLU4N_20735 [Butyricimonas faecihominis]
MIPREDKKGAKMNAAKFAEKLEAALYAQGIECSNSVGGNTIYLTLNL